MYFCGIYFGISYVQHTSRVEDRLPVQCQMGVFRCLTPKQGYKGMNTFIKETLNRRNTLGNRCLLHTLGSMESLDELL